MRDVGLISVLCRSLKSVWLSSTYSLCSPVHFIQLALESNQARLWHNDLGPSHAVGAQLGQLQETTKAADHGIRPKSGDIDEYRLHV